MNTVLCFNRNSYSVGTHYVDIGSYKNIKFHPLKKDLIKKIEVFVTYPFQEVNFFKY